MWWNLIACVLFLTAGSCNPVVNTAKGAISGRTLKSRDGRDYHSFTGIPYAKPPVDELRFKVNNLAKTHENANKTRGAIWMTENKNFWELIKLYLPLRWMILCNFSKCWWTQKSFGSIIIY